MSGNFGFARSGFAPQFERGNDNPSSSRRGRHFFYGQALDADAATRKYVEVADFVHFAQVWIFHPRPAERNASLRVELKPPDLAKRNFVLMPVGGGTLCLVADEQCALR